MSANHRAELKNIRSFPSLVRFLRDEMGWPIETDDFEEITFEYTAEELGIDAASAAKIEKDGIKRLRPLSPNQPWGIFFVKFEPKRLPVVALRRILSRVALKKRGSANSDERAAWAADDLLFVSNYGEGDARQISFAHFSQDESKDDLPTLKVLGWDNLDTPLHLDHVAELLIERLAWPDDPDAARWRESWRSAFTLRHREVITTSKMLAIRLAELARAIRDRIKTVLAIETKNGPVTKLMKAFQEALVHDLDTEGFADMYAQTIAYGLLSARVTNPHANTADGFATQLPVTNPFLKELMETFLHVGGRKRKGVSHSGIDFDELGVSEVVDLLDDANMEAVIRDFGDQNPQEDPVIHFYELFLKEYDAKKRMQRGVFYTPRPVVSYIVRSVHELLQSEFGLADGLADTATWGEMTAHHEELKIPEGVKATDRFVTILDPATGTGTFLVEAIDVIHRTLTEKWKREGNGDKKILDLWNDYVPKHLLPRLHGYELLMAPYAIAHLKIGLKLHETGYRFESDERARIYLTNSLEPASDKQLTLDFLPALAHEAEAVNAVKRHQRFTMVIGNPPYQGFSSNNGEDATRSVEPYRFCNGKPIGERNPSWLLDDYVKFLRFGQTIIEHAHQGVLAMVTNNGYIDNPTFRGLRDNFLSAFSTVSILNLNGDSKKQLVAPDSSRDDNVFAIQQGVAIGIFLLNCSARSDLVGYSDLWGSQESKMKYLETKACSDVKWTVADCRLPFLLFRPVDTNINAEFARFTTINDLFVEKGWGFKTRKDYLLVGFDKESLKCRFERMASLSPAAARQEFQIKESEYWDFEAAHRQLPKNPDASILPVLFRPFDMRFVFYEKYMIERGDHKYELMSHMFRPNVALITVRRNESNRPFDHVFCTRLPAVLHSVSAKEANFFFPFLRYGSSYLNKQKLFGSDHGEPNCKLSGNTPGTTSDFSYIYAILHSNGYRARYAEQLRIDFPRIPLPAPRGLDRKLRELGAELVALHLMESPELDEHETTLIGKTRQEIEKVSYSERTIWIDKAKTTGFKGVPEEVWNFHIGGYQVCEKWLKDRKGRTLTADDITHYHRIVVALSETIRIMGEIDEVIEAHGGWPAAFTADATTSKISVSSSAQIISLDDARVEREKFRTLLPLYSLKAAAGYFGDGESVEPEGWVQADGLGTLDDRMFVARAIGRSMEPTIRDGDYVVLRANPVGTRQGKIVLAQYHGAADPDTGGAFTIKRYSSEKRADEDNEWRHTRIVLSPLNPEYKPIVIPEESAESFRIIAEFVAVLRSPG